MVKITCTSDLHGHFPKTSGGDVLIVAGDITAHDTCLEHIKFQLWFHEQPYNHKIVVGGNHDNRLQKIGFESLNRHYDEMDMHYLCDSGIELQFEYDDIELEESGSHPSCARSIKFWGSPWSLLFDGINPKCCAFTGNEDDLGEHFSKIPADTDILITHSPSSGVLDVIKPENINVGSESLVKYVVRKKCRYHFFGHIHESYGKYVNPISGKTYINGSHVNKRYEPVNPPIDIEI